MEKPTFKLVGAPCGHHGQYTFYKALRYSAPGGAERVLALGDFFFVRLWQDSQLVSVGELQLLWTDRVSDQTLVSLRLYFLPENTPDGRGAHGQDEVLAIGEKVVVRAADLLSWACRGDGWQRGLPAVWRGACAPRPAAAELPEPLHASRLDFADVEREKAAIEDPEAPGVVVFSYPRYCRYRALLRRLDGLASAWLRDSLVAALGGYAAPTNNTRILFCRDTFEYPELEGHEFVCNHLAPRLKGRPRGRRRRRARSHSLDPPSGRERSPSDTSVSSDRERDKREPTPPRAQLRNGAGGVEERATDRAFMSQLRAFHRDRSTPLKHAHSLKDLRLRSLYQTVVRGGGYEQVCRERGWRGLHGALQGRPASPSQATLTRRHYERLLLPFEKHERRNGSKWWKLPKLHNGTSKEHSPKQDRKKHHDTAPITTIDITAESPVREIIEQDDKIVPRLCTPSPTHDKIETVNLNSSGNDSLVKPDDDKPPTDPYDPSNLLTTDEKDTKEQKPAAELNQEFLDSLPKQDRPEEKTPIKISVKPVEKLIERKTPPTSSYMEPSPMSKLLGTPGLTEYLQKQSLTDLSTSLLEMAAKQNSDTPASILAEMASKQSFSEMNSGLIAEMAAKQSVGEAGFFREMAAKQGVGEAGFFREMAAKQGVGEAGFFREMAAKQGVGEAGFFREMAAKQGVGEAGFFREIAAKQSLGEINASFLAEIARAQQELLNSSALEGKFASYAALAGLSNGQLSNGAAAAMQQATDKLQSGVGGSAGTVSPPSRPAGRSLLRSVRVKPTRTTATAPPTPSVTPLRPDSASSSPPAPPLTNFGISYPPERHNAVSSSTQPPHELPHSDDEIVEVPYKPKTPEIIDLDEYDSPDSPQAIKKKKLDILKERGLEVTAVSGEWQPASPGPPALPPLPATMLPNTMLGLNPAVQQQIMTQAQFFQMYNQIMPQGYTNGLTPPKVIQGKSIYGSPGPEKTVYGNPKDPFMPPPHVLQGAPLSKQPRCLQAPAAVAGADVLDLSSKQGASPKPAVEIMRVPTVPSPAKAGPPQNLTPRSYSLIDGKAVVGSNLEITLVKPKTPQPTTPPKGARPRQKRSSTGQFMSNKTPATSRDSPGYPKPYTMTTVAPSSQTPAARLQDAYKASERAKQATNIVIPSYQMSNSSRDSDVSPTSSTGSRDGIAALTSSLLQAAGGALLQSPKVPSNLAQIMEMQAKSTAQNLATFMDPSVYMSAVYSSLAGQLAPGLPDQHQLAMYQNLMSSRLMRNYPGLLNMSTVTSTPTTKN